MKIKYFIPILALLIFGCGKSDEELKLLADVNMKNQKIEEAVKTLEQLVTEFPESNYAPQAAYDLANIYKNGALPKLPKDQSLKKALEYFSLVAEKYPDFKEAPIALFMKGFIENNDFRKFDEAKKTYNLFISKYPNHQLAEAAKNELSTIGLTPEQILEKAQKQL